MDQRYSRQLLLHYIGEKGQLTLNNSRVLIVGLGAIGTVLANHLVRAGVGYVWLMDNARMSWRELQHVMLLEESDVREGTNKVKALEKKLARINSTVNISALPIKITKENIKDYINDFDVVLSGTNNEATNVLLSDYCYHHGIPFTVSNIYGSTGYQFNIVPGLTPCLRCLISTLPATIRKKGQLSTFIDTVASFQAIETLKLLVTKKEMVRKSILAINAWDNEIEERECLRAKDDCPTCKHGNYVM